MTNIALHSIFFNLMKLVIDDYKDLFLDSLTISFPVRCDLLAMVFTVRGLAWSLKCQVCRGAALPRCPPSPNAKAFSKGPPPLSPDWPRGELLPGSLQLTSQPNF